MCAQLFVLTLTMMKASFIAYCVSSNPHTLEIQHSHKIAMAVLTKRMWQDEQSNQKWNHEDWICSKYT